MKSKKMERREDLKHVITARVSNDTQKDYDNMGNMFKGCYPRLRWRLVSMSIKLMAKTIKEKKLKPGDDLEAELGI